jgi:hypothetical protein
VCLRCVFDIATKRPAIAPVPIQISANGAINVSWAPAENPIERNLSSRLVRSPCSSTFPSARGEST